MDVLVIITLAMVAVYFCTQAFNYREDINRLEQQNENLGSELNETKLKLDYYQRGVNDSH